MRTDSGSWFNKRLLCDEDVSVFQLETSACRMNQYGDPRLTDTAYAKDTRFLGHKRRVPSQIFQMAVLSSKITFRELRDQRFNVFL